MLLFRTLTFYFLLALMTVLLKKCLLPRFQLDL